MRRSAMQETDDERKLRKRWQRLPAVPLFCLF